MHSWTDVQQYVQEVALTATSRVYFVFNNSSIPVLKQEQLHHVATAMLASVTDHAPYCELLCNCSLVRWTIQQQFCV